MKVYGIKACDTVRKALKFLKEKGVEFDFVDLKKEPVSYETIDRWLSQVELALFVKLPLIGQVAFGDDAEDFAVLCDRRAVVEPVGDA